MSQVEKKKDRFERQVQVTIDALFEAEDRAISRGSMEVARITRGQVQGLEISLAIYRTVKMELSPEEEFQMPHEFPGRIR